MVCFFAVSPYRTRPIRGDMAPALSRSGRAFGNSGGVLGPKAHTFLQPHFLALKRVDALAHARMGQLAIQDHSICRSAGWLASWISSRDLDGCLLAPGAELVRRSLSRLTAEHRVSCTVSDSANGDIRRRGGWPKVGSAEVPASFKEACDMANRQVSTGRLSKVIAVFLCATVSWAVAQTHVTPPKNKYTPAQDVELGQQAAKEVEQQLPVLRDDGIESFVDRIGRRLVEVMPDELQHPEFRYSFKVINVREINAFALPGGPMYINRGMMQAARSRARSPA